MNKAPSHAKRLLTCAFIASAITGIALHCSSHTPSHEAWHNWAMAHVLTSSLWLVSAIFHIKQHRKWYKNLLSEKICKMNPATIALSATFLAEVITGIVLLACVDGGNSAIGLWHFGLGIMLAALSIIHINKHKKRKNAQTAPTASRATPSAKIKHTKKPSPAYARRKLNSRPR